MEGFWSFAKERLIKHHGISPRKFLLYLKEMGKRYNNRNEDLFDKIVHYMLRPIKLEKAQKYLSLDKLDLEASYTQSPKFFLHIFAGGVTIIKL